MEKQVGLVRALVIVWLSGTVASLAVDLSLSPLAEEIAKRSPDDATILATALALMAVKALIGAACVVAALTFFDFALSYATAVVAVGLGLALVAVVTRFVLKEASADATAVAVPLIGTILWPLWIVLGAGVPAFLIDELATPRRGSRTPTGRRPKGHVAAGRPQRGAAARRDLADRIGDYGARRQG